MVMPTPGLDQSAIADAINRKYQGYSQKQKNQMMQAGTTDPGSFAMQYQPEIQQAQQPSEFQGSKVLQGISDASQNQNEDVFKQMRSNYGLSDLPWNVDSGSGSVQSSSDITNPSHYRQSVLDALAGKPPSVQNPFNSIFSIGDPNYAKTFDPLYSTTYTKNLMQNAGASLGMSSSDVDKLAGLVTAKQYNTSPQAGYYSMQNKSGDYINVLNDFAKLKYGSTLPDSANQYLTDQGNRINSYAGELLKAANNVDTHHGGFLGGIFSVVDPLLDTLDPMHNQVQKWTTGESETSKQSPYFQQYAGPILSAFLPGAGAAVSSMQGASNRDATAALLPAISYGLSSYLGTPTTNADGTSSGIYGSGTSLGSVGADRAAQSFITKAGLGTLASGGNLQKGLSSGISSSLGDYLSNETSDILGESGSKALGGAASGGLNSLFSKNSPITGSLFGGLSGGLHGYLNSVDRQTGEYTPTQNQQNQQTGKSLSNLIRLLVKRK